MSILGYITDLGNMIESIALFFFAFDFVTRNPLQVAGVDKTDIDSPPGSWQTKKKSLCYPPKTEELDQNKEEHEV
ncbi:predicted protein [Histoplasma mississippiense (nom. inval.)]|uniref:predicted protein n=1 Tax=Ajellomyces capsulatus (strain NAm1 / WU24) TaxID=2059318 RepID=UPI000157CA69|nr:predicted protein [Histoplasma mississippiense (nom. inval.)]EDN09086.1 predicted protein [Histoplasma mississippiense (nom. inval.)]